MKNILFLSLFLLLVATSFAPKEQATDFEATTIEGEKIKLSDLKGKIVVLNFWFKACKPCIMEIPELHLLAEKYKSENVVFIALALDSEEVVKEFLEKEKFGYKHIANARVIANSSRISEKTKERVREAMKELGYHPNLNARSLANKSTKTIGVVMPNSAKIAFQNPFFPEVIRGISTKAHQEGFGLYLSTGQTEDEIFEEVKQMVYGGRVDGILLLYSRVDDKVMPFLIEQGFPFVLIGRPYDIDEDQVTFVNNDNFKAAKTVTEYLMLLGHEKIGFIGGNLDYVVTIDHLKGYKQALINANIPVRDDYIVHHEELEKGGQDAVIELMSLE
ncbi:MAG: redoxin domain-containing protein, partial [Raineya sp.]